MTVIPSNNVPFYAIKLDVSSLEKNTTHSMHLSRSFRYGLIKITIYLLTLVLFISILRSIRWEFYNDDVTMVFARKNSNVFMWRLKMFPILIQILQRNDMR